MRDKNPGSLYPLWYSSHVNDRMSAEYSAKWNMITSRWKTELSRSVPRFDVSQKIINKRETLRELKPCALHSLCNIRSDVKFHPWERISFLSRLTRRYHVFTRRRVTCKVTICGFREKLRRRRGKRRKDNYTRNRTKCQRVRKTRVGTAKISSSSHLRATRGKKLNTTRDEEQFWN